MRINLYAGPGAGKSTTAAWLFAELKKLGYSVELVSEYVKSWAIAKRKVIGFDQIYLMGKQLNYEYRFLSNGIQNIVTDSPVLLSACYTRTYFGDLEIADHMEAIIKEYEIRNPSLNIYLNRDGKDYKTEGRYQGAEEAIEIDVIVRKALLRLGIPFKEFSFFDQEQILRYVTTAIDIENKEKEDKRIADSLAWFEGLSELDAARQKERERNVYDPEYVASKQTCDAIAYQFFIDGVEKFHPYKTITGNELKAIIAQGAFENWNVYVATRDGDVKVDDNTTYTLPEEFVSSPPRFPINDG